MFDVELPSGHRPAVIVTRDSAIPFLANVCVAEITTTARGLPTEVAVGERQGLDYDSVVNCDNLNMVSKERVRSRRGALGPEELFHLRAALQTALELD